MLCNDGWKLTMTVFHRSRPGSHAAMATPRSSTSKKSSQLRIRSANLTLWLRNVLMVGIFSGELFKKKEKMRLRSWTNMPNAANAMTGYHQTSTQLWSAADRSGSSPGGQRHTKALILIVPVQSLGTLLVSIGLYVSDSLGPRSALQKEDALDARRLEREKLSGPRRPQGP